MTLAARLSALRADVADVPMAKLDKYAGLRGGTLWKVQSGAWGENMGGAIAAKFAALFGASLDHVLLGAGRKPSREDVGAAVERAKRAWERANGRHPAKVPPRNPVGKRSVRSGSAGDRSICTGKSAIQGAAR